MSLADELLADLEELEDDDEEVEEDEEMADPLAAQIEAIKNAASVEEIAKLAESEQLNRILTSIDEFQAAPREEIFGAVEEDPEYKLIVEANNLLMEIDNEIGLVHKYVRDFYVKRYPELEQLVLNPLDYIRTIKALGNELDPSKINHQLADILAPATIMVVSVTASTTQGKNLNEEELRKTMHACDVAMSLVDAKQKIFDYVESRMFFLSPNLTHICGATTAAMILGAAGGLTALSKMPACNIQVLGAQKKTLAGFSAAAMLPHTGYVYYCELAQRQPTEYRRKAARLVAAKCALAARVDSYSQGGDRVPTLGIKLRADIEKKLEKAQEPPPGSLPKPLPKPDAERKKRRGGARKRKMKERESVTEARKQANRMEFGKIEEDVLQDDLGYSLGKYGQGTTGKFGAMREEKKKTGTLSKKMQRELQKQRARSSSGLSTVRTPASVSSATTAGTASVAFTPMQGLEIVNPKAVERRVQDANAKYFGSDVAFKFAAKKDK